MKIKILSLKTSGKSLFLAIAFCFVLHWTHGRSATYSVFSAQQELLGMLKVNTVETDTLTKIVVVSEFSVKLLMTVHVKYTLTSIYRNKELEFNSIKTYKNNELNSYVSTVKVGSEYRYIKDGQESVYPKSIPFAESLLYFNEPEDLISLYSEFDGVDKAIFKAKAGHYKIKNPLNGNVSEYFYENGSLKSAIVHLQMMALYISRD